MAAPVTTLMAFVPGGAVCQSGVCVDEACESGGYLCPEGSFCDGKGSAFRILVNPFTPTVL